MQGAGGLFPRVGFVDPSLSVDGGKGGPQVFHSTCGGSGLTGSLVGFGLCGCLTLMRSNDCLVKGIGLSLLRRRRLYKMWCLLPQGFNRRIDDGLVPMQRFGLNLELSRQAAQHQQAAQGLVG